MLTRVSYLSNYAVKRRRNEGNLFGQAPMISFAKPSVDTIVVRNWRCIFFPLPGALFCEDDVEPRIYMLLFDTKTKKNPHRRLHRKAILFLTKEKGNLSLLHQQRSFL
jgi:hypothetical protein